VAQDGVSERARMSDRRCPVCGYPCIASARVCSVCGWDFSPLFGGRPEDAQRAFEIRLEQGRREWSEKIRRGERKPFSGGENAPAGTSPVAVLEERRTNSIGVEFALIPAGGFMMGSGKADRNAYRDEKPAHSERIGKPFYLGRFQVTQAQWEAVMGGNPSRFSGPKRPVERISWEEAQEFIERLNLKEGHQNHRLPTEAEWEYAARAGTTGAYSFGDAAGELRNHAWYLGNSGHETHPVGEKEPNAWGLHDMHGNVWEWVRDEYRAYSSGSAEDLVVLPQNAYRAPGSGRVVRGGGWNSGAGFCRSAYRHFSAPANRDDSIGFRLALTVKYDQVSEPIPNPYRMDRNPYRVF
jgi:formylglycine-generating enzyme required for sulfatase activity